MALSDAPRNAAELRTKWLRLDGHFDALYTLPGYALPKNVDPEIRRREEAGHYRSRTPVRELPREVLPMDVPTGESYRQELVYSGLSKNTITLSYREYKNDIARPVFVQDLAYDLAFHERSRSKIYG